MGVKRGGTGVGACGSQRAPSPPAPGRRPAAGTAPSGSPAMRQAVIGQHDVAQRHADSPDRLCAVAAVGDGRQADREAQRILGGPGDLHDRLVVQRIGHDGAGRAVDFQATPFSCVSTSVGRRVDAGQADGLAVVRVGVRRLPGQRADGAPRRSAHRPGAAAAVWPRHPSASPWSRPSAGSTAPRPRCRTRSRCARGRARRRPAARRPRAGTASARAVDRSRRPALAIHAAGQEAGAQRRSGRRARRRSPVPGALASSSRTCSHVRALQPSCMG